MLGVVQGGQGPGLGQAVDVEGLAHAVQQVRDPRVADAVAHPQGGQAVDLGEGAGDDQVGELPHPAAGVREVRLLDVIGVGLVHHHHAGQGQGGDEAVEPIRRQPGPGGVVGVGDPHHPGLRVDQVLHGVQVVAIVAGRGDPGPGPDRLGGDGVDGEGVLGEDGLDPGLEEGAGDQIQDIVGAVAQGDGGGIDPVLASQGGAQLEAAAVRVAAEFTQGRLDRRPRQPAGAQRVLVGGELDGAADAELTLQLGDGLAGEIGLQPGDAGGGDGEEGVGRHGAGAWS